MDLDIVMVKVCGTLCIYQLGFSVWGRFLAIIGRCPTIFKSNRLHVNIFSFSFYEIGGVLCGFLLVFPIQPVYMLTSFGVFFMNMRYIPKDSSKMIGNFLEVLNFNRLFLKLNRFSCNYCSGWFSSFIGINNTMWRHLQTWLQIRSWRCRDWWCCRSAYASALRYMNIVTYMLRAALHYGGEVH